ncbi:biotin transporter BioY [Haloferax mediterranei ATCC 33500]|uniref:Biotin biosynthesis protein BioY n=1 Tax=Haloferax mediterranei (strain ATCC 33500 / DSM 1411 / JCM 8866 / NBRC 14739 / NCIMB 2177 / R-4) TaxID=523841 RepID=I3R153_HALMT|nr:biotin transporter BioY [Haloferax mediterranei]AFK17963.1 biotin synthesis protein [Haloferax mediterranei ATCC 33500]AHZ22615.1 biotin biosynthesis protein BioY [Haloferax mediterranei ATCC 33500]EMA02759.1 biotin synthesis protein [Haloferax mediterranei ATCC 33500]MDX5988056.1 biotin transporter BioY [Haloferax mediterranei ATCC 33500]QCQ74515.1 biotin transporter BioY [Haloferax mediterranei ATCC 33500]
MAAEHESVELVGDELVGNIARAALFAALMGASSYVSFPNPISPIPVTMQVLVVFLAGIFLGPVWGGVSMGLYLVAGGLGAPVFSGGSAGLAPLVGPTAGYLWSYPIAAALVGALVHGGVSLGDYRVSTVRLVGAMVAGTVVIYALGTVGFAYVQGVSLGTAFGLASAAFIPFETFKIAAAVGIVRSDAIAAN